MAEVGYNSKFEGLEVDSRMEKVIQAEVATTEAEGKGGLIPAPPAGSQDGSKTLLSNMTWGEHVTKQYIDDAVSAAGWKKQIVSALPEVDAAKDNIMYLVKDDLASTETKNVYNEYILVTDEGGAKSLESLGMVSTGVDVTFVDLTPFSQESGSVNEEVYGQVAAAYEGKVIVGFSQDGGVLPVSIIKVENTYSIVVNKFRVGADGDSISLNSVVFNLGDDYNYTSNVFDSDLTKTEIEYIKFMSATPKVVATLANLPKDAHNIIANVSSATSLSMSVAASDVGREWQVRVNNTTGSEITQPLPTSGNFQSMSGDSVAIPASGFIELSIWYINDKLVIRVGENA